MKNPGYEDVIDYVHVLSFSYEHKDVLTIAGKMCPFSVRSKTVYRNIHVHVQVCFLFRAFILKHARSLLKKMGVESMS